MAAKTKNKRSVTKSALRIIDLDLIKIDKSYQRDVSPTAQRKIIQYFNQDALGIPVVGERSDGSMWIVDGLQRTTALKTLGKRTVRAEVFASSGPEHEAQVFHDINKNRVPLKPLQIFHASLTAGDKVSWEIKELIEKFGFRVAKYGENPNKLEIKRGSQLLRAINTIIYVYDKSGADGLSFVLSVIKECWADDIQRTSDTIIFGLYQFWMARNKIVDMKRLVPRLNSTTPAKIVYTSQLGIGSRGANAAATIDKIYRKRKA